MASTTVSNKNSTAAGDLSSLILKGSVMSDKDAGFCSGEDDLDVDDVHSPTDGSEDSIEVKVTPISPRNKNKRKCAEPRKVPLHEIGPLKKRIRRDLLQDEQNATTNPFRPWSNSSVVTIATASTKENNNNILSPVPPTYHPVYGYQFPPPQIDTAQEEPLSLVKEEKDLHNKYPQTTQQSSTHIPSITERITSQQPDPGIRTTTTIRAKEFARFPPASNIPSSTLPLITASHRVPPHPAIRPPSSASSLEHMSVKFNVDTLLKSPVPSSSTASTSTAPSHHTKSSTSTSTSPSTHMSGAGGGHSHSKEHRNYKNMTRERRIEANARERTRVHTISAAFDTLRRAIPAYSHNQKLSKLSVLRIACSYILTLSRVAGYDYSIDQSEPSLGSCVDLVSRTIQTEGKLRKKRDE